MPDYDITRKDGEKRKTKFTITRDGTAIDLTNYTATFVITDGDYDVQKTVADSSFDKSEKADGILYAPWTADFSTGEFVGELTLVAPTTLDKDISVDITILIQASRNPDNES